MLDKFSYFLVSDREYIGKDAFSRLTISIRIENLCLAANEMRFYSASRLGRTLFFRR